MSVNHQFIQHEDTIVKRYTKTINSMVSGRRLDPNRPENEMVWLLRSPDGNFRVIWTGEGDQPRCERIAFSYDDEVVELYSEKEVRLFERQNRKLIESGVLKEYSEISPAIDTTNLLKDEEVEAIATTKQPLSFKKKVSTITSIYTLDRILVAVQAHDRPFSFVKTVQERIKELQ
jgi:hypothetical protein